ncbi:MAG: aromatic ring-hydroxylating dioxygenase subunit alpha [Phycisphaerae bacterium]|nr:MAG: aromatic ring-hydroxylating dioxygenase subunit alpha [Planctomycetota bacterium]KAB2949790.1 MAG: aromatic ring-hydroxylating dioxygenase subunit alpha [Phycisphaerae bacterium]MBE7457004.1 aromatic ring-hydroxylating dioxygenase subunit alpha [Planctomycetia bacterium]MCK6463637.1 aromatic ring-hydroxylating dioxygenase subunit alpha [Phycisphaerae bacterium]MCL4718306.1 aromatic ring-hydroxylating dioxygenase subunit alpha [Phycisphaerae bacterium]
MKNLDPDTFVAAYDPTRPLAEASTIPSAWYTDPAFAEYERRAVFHGSWQQVARADQLVEPGSFVTADVAGEPIVVVRGNDRVLRAFFNVCRHHAAAVVDQPCGSLKALKCPYHGWTYGLNGELKGVPEFDGVLNFNRADHGLVPARVETWEGFVFVCLDDAAPPLAEHLGRMALRVAPLNLSTLRFVARKTYDLACNWKVFVDNYLDGGYHVPHIHKGLGSVLSYQEYRIECEDRYCLQSSPITAEGGEGDTASVRGGAKAYYFWLHPNFMLNWYAGYMDTNLVLPLGVDRCRVIFDFYFESGGDDEHRRSIAVADRIQDEDIAICESVQRGLHSRAYDVGRLCVRREGGEHLFHRLLHADLTRKARGG